MSLFKGTIAFYARQNINYAIARLCSRNSVCASLCPSVTRVDQSTRKLCYRKDDRAMRPTGAMKIFCSRPSPSPAPNRNRIPKLNFDAYM